MTEVPTNFPTYTSYSPRTLIQHVDILKQCIRELQAEVTSLKAAKEPAKQPKEKANG